MITNKSIFPQKPIQLEESKPLKGYTMFCNNKGKVIIIQTPRIKTQNFIKNANKRTNSKFKKGRKFKRI